jgi:hypothetical protein
MADIFELGELPLWMQDPELDHATVTLNRRFANGWLQDATGLTEWPDPIPDRLWAWAIELAAIANRWPDGSSRDAIDDHQATLDRERRAEILNAARAAYPSGAGAPLGEFPEPDWHWRATDPTCVLTD